MPGNFDILKHMLSTKLDNGELSYVESRMFSSLAWAHIIYELNKLKFYECPFNMVTYTFVL